MTQQYTPLDSYLWERKEKRAAFKCTEICIKLCKRVELILSMSYTDNDESGH